MLLSLGVPSAILLSLIVVLGLDSTFWIVSVSSFVFLLSLLAIRIFLKRSLPTRQKGVIAFFHPNANGGGGGERVLWCGIKGIQEAYPNAKIVIYSAEQLSKSQLCASVAKKFGLTVRDNIQVVYLPNASLLDANRYPRFTLIGQAVGSIALSFTALQKLRPQVFVDTAGWAFAYPLVRLAGVKVACYTHYPIISTDMLLRVAQRKRMYNNEGFSSTRLGAVLKLVYYYTFASLYGVAGGCANVVMVNSSWTKNHIGRLWWKLEDAKVVFPPCNTKELQQIQRNETADKTERLLVSIAQFRPEKNQQLQVEAFADAKRRLASQGQGLDLRLAIAGGCRNADDEARAASLQKTVQDLGLQDSIQFYKNAPYSQILDLLEQSVAGLNTMVDEHFGISVVEYMAAGVIPITHNSGGPKEDIVEPSGPACCGFLCETSQEFSESIQKVATMPFSRRQSYIKNARRKAQQFSDERFETDFLACLQNLLLLLE